MKTSLYLHLYASGALLYVGISHHPLLRELQHRREKKMSMVASITLDWFDCRNEASKAELIAIKNERPLWNVGGTKTKQPKKKYKARPNIDYDARLKAALDAFNAMLFCEQIKSLGSYQNWKAKGFPGFNKPVEDLET